MSPLLRRDRRAEYAVEAEYDDDDDDDDDDHDVCSVLGERVVECTRGAAGDEYVAPWCGSGAAPPVPESTVGISSVPIESSAGANSANASALARASSAPRATDSLSSW